MTTQLNPFHVGLDRGKRRTLAEIEAATIGHNASSNALRRQAARPVPRLARTSEWVSRQRVHLGEGDFMELDEPGPFQPRQRAPVLASRGNDSTSQHTRPYAALPRPGAGPSRLGPYTPPSSQNLPSNGRKRKFEDDEDVMIVQPPPGYRRTPVVVDLTNGDYPKRRTSFLGNRDDDVIVIDPPAAEMRRSLRSLVLGRPRAPIIQPEAQVELQVRAQVEPQVGAQVEPQVEPRVEILPQTRSRQARRPRRRLGFSYASPGRRDIEAESGVRVAPETQVVIQPSFRARPVRRNIEAPSGTRAVPDAIAAAASVVQPIVVGVNHFFKLAREIRDKIYRYLLVSPNPIRVWALWTQLARRPVRRVARRGYSGDNIGTTIDTGILRVCRLTAEEGRHILYSENSFLYLLRDPEVVVENASSERQKRMRRSAHRAAMDRLFQNSIHLNKYGHLIRHMAIELESNRTGPTYERLMRAALEVLAPNDESSPLAPSPLCEPIHLHTLTITISPLLESNHRLARAPAQGNQDGTVHDGRHLTMVSIFSRGGPVIKTLERINIDFLRINVHVNSDAGTIAKPRLTGPSSSSDSDSDSDSDSNTSSTSTSNKPRHRHLETTIDLRYLPRRMDTLARDKLVGHLWENDVPMQEARQRRAAEAADTLVHLRRHLEDACLRPEKAVMKGGIWEDHCVAERRRRERRAMEEKRFDVDAYDDAEEEGGKEDERRVARGEGKSLIISISRVGEELRVYRA